VLPANTSVCVCAIVCLCLFFLCLSCAALWHNKERSSKNNNGHKAVVYDVFMCVFICSLTGTTLWLGWWKFMTTRSRQRQCWMHLDHNVIRWPLIAFALGLYWIRVSTMWPTASSPNTNTSICKVPTSASYFVIQSALCFMPLVILIKDSNRFTAGLEYVRVHPGQQVPER